MSDGYLTVSNNGNVTDVRGNIHKLTDLINGEAIAIVSFRILFTVQRRPHGATSGAPGQELTYLTILTDFFYETWEKV